MRIIPGQTRLVGTISGQASLLLIWRSIYSDISCQMSKLSLFNTFWMSIHFECQYTLNIKIFCGNPPTKTHFEVRSLWILKHYSPQNITLLKIRKDNKPVSRSGLGLGQLLLVVDEQVQLVAHGLHLQGHRQVHVKFIVKFTVSLFIDKINSTFASTSLILSYNWGLNWALIWLIKMN